MPFADGSPQPTNVSPSGVVVTIPIFSTHRDKKLQRLVVQQTAGSAGSFTAEFSTDQSFADRTKGIAGFDQVSLTDPVDFTGPFDWEGGANVYCRIIPDVGSDNNFKVRVFPEP